MDIQDINVSIYFPFVYIYNTYKLFNSILKFNNKSYYIWHSFHRWLIYLKSVVKEYIYSRFD